MQGLWLEHQTLSIQSDLPIPEPKANEALVKVLNAGICNTDLELIRGYYPYTGILGHEFVGVVEQGPEHLQGQRVVGEINATCGDCHFCHTDQPTHCENRTVLGIVNHHGAFANYLTLPHQNLHPVPDSVDTDVATFTEPVAAALEIQEQINIHASDRVLVIGAGKLGSLVAQTLALKNCNLLVVGQHTDKLANLAAEGINTSLTDKVVERTFDIAVDCTGHPDGFDLARRALRPRGILVLKSTYAGKLSIDVSTLVVDEITVIGSRCGPFDKALNVLAQGNVNVKPLIHAHYPLSEGLNAFDHARQRGVLKVLLNMT